MQGELGKAHVPVQHVLNLLGKGLAISALSGLALLVSNFLISGLPKKEPQHPLVKDGCPKSWVLFMGLVYTFTYFTTDQYSPSLPRMEVDLGATQDLMSATIQMNFVIKAVTGIFTATLSDRIGRRPAIFACLILLSMASFCCAFARSIEWFIAGRLLQGIGESVEPVIFAMVRDYFPRNEERFMIVSALQMMSTVGMLLAPVLGGYSAELCSWRASFVVLSALWAVMAAYAGLNMVETCPDADPEQPGPGPSWSRFLTWHCLSLLLTESCNMAAYMTFSTNVSYFIEVAHGKSTMTCSTVMLAFGALNAGELFLMERLPLGDTLQKAKTSVSLYAASGVLFLFLAAFYYNYLWAYLLGSYLQAGLSIFALVSVNVLYFEPLKDCAGLAASVEIVAKSVIPSFYSAVSTQSLMRSGAQGLMMFQAAAVIGTGITFWCYAMDPPQGWEPLEAAKEAPFKDLF